MSRATLTSSIVLGLALLGVSVAEAAERRIAPSRSADAVRTSVRHRKHTVTTTLRHRKAGTVKVTMNVPRQCNVKKFMNAVERQINANPDAFWQRGNGTVNIQNLPVGVGFDFPGRRGKKRGEKDKDDNDPMAGFEGVIADMLAMGTHSQDANGNGQTCFDGTNMDLAALVPWNDSAAPITTSTGKDNPDGSHTITKENADGSVTRTTIDKDNNKVLSVSTSKTTKSDGVSLRVPGGTLGGAPRTTTKTVTDDKVNGTKITSETTKVQNITTTKSTTNFKDGSSTTTHSTKTKSGGDTTEKKITDNHDKNGKHTGGEITIYQNGKVQSSKKTPPEKSKDKQGGNVSLTPEGYSNVPGVCVSDEAISTLLNWNKLQGALVNPAPHEDGPGEVTKSRTAGPCGELDDAGFDPDPNYLRPNKQGWVTDPVPAMRSRDD